MSTKKKASAAWPKWIHTSDVRFDVRCLWRFDGLLDGVMNFNADGTEHVRIYGSFAEYMANWGNIVTFISADTAEAILADAKAKAEADKWPKWYSYSGGCGPLGDGISRLRRCDSPDKRAVMFDPDTLEEHPRGTSRGDTYATSLAFKPVPAAEAEAELATARAELEANRWPKWFCSVSGKRVYSLRRCDSLTALATAFDGETLKETTSPCEKGAYYVDNPTCWLPIPAAEAEAMLAEARAELDAKQWPKWYQEDNDSRPTVTNIRRCVGPWVYAVQFDETGEPEPHSITWKGSKYEKAHQWTRISADAAAAIIAAAKDEAKATKPERKKADHVKEALEAWGVFKGYATRFESYAILNHFFEDLKAK
ncbi:MAG: hypothetical protein EHM48_07180 [Planctomycetaceae bacterium]|nr:MAG: hypothetical protein EHM48_07180 [Planctomycetaceae bacterium]